MIEELKRRENGSSPRLRGTRIPTLDMKRRRRFIPAPAGNARVLPATTGEAAVHPRACGEREVANGAAPFHGGSSPRLRGTLLGVLDLSIRARFIPAPAGNAYRISAGQSSSPVHPRACGERVEHAHCPQQARGSSPRLRGTRRRGRCPRSASRFIPAPAGNASAGRSPLAFMAVHPRACGERGLDRDRRVIVDGSSPRLRGTRVGQTLITRNSRFIPAPAGNA